jgi:hypothetical protein
VNSALILSALLRLGVAHPEPTADAIAHNARTPVEAAFLIAWGRAESLFSERIIANDCRRWECDHGRARGAWQLHAGAVGKDWAFLPGNVELQARYAGRMTRWALRQCPADPVRGGFRVLGGLGCDRELKGEQSRVETFRKVLVML